VLGLVMKALVVVMDGDREHLLGVALADDVVVEDFADFFGMGTPSRDFTSEDFSSSMMSLQSSSHSSQSWPGDKLAHLLLAHAAKRAIERILRIAARDLAHPHLPSIANAGAL
jgi:hypothetical protein